MQPVSLAFWDAWKELPNWYDKYWGSDSWKHITREDWTRGVIAPFLVTHIASSLECRIRFERKIDSSSPVDYELVKKGKVFAYIEHENHFEYGQELDKLRKYGKKAKLNCLISYVVKGDEDFKIESIKRLIVPDITSSSDPEWLIIFGVCYPTGDLVDINQWIGCTIFFDGAKTDVRDLTF